MELTAVRAVSAVARREEMGATMTITSNKKETYMWVIGG
jgi:hypothetical protein